MTGGPGHMHVAEDVGRDDYRVTDTTGELSRPLAQLVTTRPTPAPGPLP